MTLPGTLLAFIVALGSLVVLHELGHYLVARWCGVKVLRFSVGMGRIVWSRRFGRDQTEWAISALPLGGYVKMLDAREPETGVLSEQDLKREFTHQNVWRRIAIVAAGPLANFLVALVLLTGLYMHGIEEPASKVRVTQTGTPAYAQGLRNGDTILAVNGKPTPGWSELRWQLMEAVMAKREARLEVARPSAAASTSNSRASSLATPSASFTATFPASLMAAQSVDGDVLGTLGLGLASPPAVLGEVMADGPAARAGLQRGDLVTAIDGKPVPDWVAMTELVRALPGKAVTVDGRRDGQSFTLALTPDSVREGAVTVGKIKAGPGALPDMIRVASAPAEAVVKAADKVWNNAVMMLRTLGRMITGEASLKNLTGPITIADYAGQTARDGAVSYLSFIAFISISLGVMNLLPIPVLDGGLLLYYSLEVLTGRPVPPRVGEIAQRVGVGLLFALMALAVLNDVSRLLT
jgi:regulator of sigma E protease